eukprot:TRINITY_DN78439_c0_g1_i1.p1 TRINITY_DN78439_c0_g1~~TRINITY_DN78439_c0_g1_i1.p1  ORF type:complete len:410 (+),score=59.76 TRINITY_DN78439_c0_g1_i1:46-1275(+)
MASFNFNPRLHWTLAIIVLLVDIAIVVTVVILDRAAHVPPPEGGATDTSAFVGWLGVLGGIFIFGCYGVLIKTPAVDEAKCDCMVFQSYYSAAVAFTSMLIWLFAASNSGLVFTWSSFFAGVIFSILWISSQALGYNAIQALGYAVAPAIWIGVTIVVSFVWGVVVFANPVKNWVGALCGIACLLLGVVLAATSNRMSRNDARQTQGSTARELLSSSTPEATAPHDAECERSVSDTSAENHVASGKKLAGVLSAAALGLCNGSLMAPMTCYQNACPAIGIEKYTGTVLAPLAFLPSLAAGLVVVHPILFFLYWSRSMAKGVMPQFHFSKVAVPGLLTGAFWAMGNFCAMYATVYLGQTIGFPLTQLCLILNGIWGILYYREIVGPSAIGTFILAALVILAGATADGMFG